MHWGWGMSGRSGRALAALAVSLLVVLLLGSGVADASTLTAQWTAKVGSSGVNGSATIKVYSSGTGSLTVGLKHLAHATTYTEAIHRGTCARPSTKLLSLPNFKTTSTGTFARVNALSAAQTKLINRAGEIIRMVSGTHVFCGAFASVKVAPPPPPPPVVAATITVGRDPTGVAITPNGILVANWYDGTLSRVDPATNSVLSAIPLNITGNVGPQAVAFGEGAIWVATYAFDDAGTTRIAGSVLRVDPTSGLVTATIPVGKASLGITTSPGAVWVTNYEDSTVTRIDSASNAVVATIPVGTGPVGVTFDFGSAWVSSDQAGTVSRIDPSTNTVVATVQTIGGSEMVTSGAGSIWVSNWGHTGIPDGVLSRVDPATNQVVRTIAIGTNPFAIAFGGGYVWVALYGEGNVAQVNPTTNTIQSKTSTGQLVIGASGKVFGLQGIAADAHNVWVVQPLPAPDENSGPLPGRVIRLTY
jgi:YVTN family beta-propeller protein